MIDNSFSPSQVGYNQSGILGTLDMGAVRPDFQEKLFNRYGDQYTNDFQLFLRMHGAMKPSQNAEGGFLFEENRYDSVVTVLANNGSAGSVLNFTLDPSEIELLGSSYYVYPQQYDDIVDMETMTRGQIQSVTTGATTTIVVNSLDSSTWTAPTAGKQYAIYSNNRPENSDGPLSRNSYWEKKFYQLQVIRESATTTDLALGDKLFPQYDQFNRFVGNWGGVSVTQADFRMIKEIYSNLWISQNKTNAAVSGTTTTGYFQEFSTSANPIDVGADDYVTHFYDMTSALLTNSPMSMNYYGLINRNLDNPIRQDLSAYFENANIVAVSRQMEKFMFGESATEGMYARFDFQTLTMNGFNIGLRANKASWDPIVLGIDPTKNYFANTAYFSPTQETRDAEGNMGRNCQLRYLEIAGVSQVGQKKTYIWETGALASVPTNRQLNKTYDLAAWTGNQFYNLNQCAFLFKNVGS